MKDIMLWKARLYPHKRKLGIRLLGKERLFCIKAGKARQLTGFE